MCVCVCDLFFNVDENFVKKYGRNAYTLGSYFQGALMEIVGQEMAASLHANQGNGANTYAQSVNLVQNETGVNLVWRITAVGENLQEKLINKLRPENLGLLHIRKIDTTLVQSGFQITSLMEFDEYKKQLLQIFNGISASGELLNRHRLQFETPTSFKSGGENLIMPTPRLILQNLAMRFASIMGQEHDLPEGMAEEFAKSVRISNYSLRSHYMPIEQTKIPAFIGNLTLAVRGAESLKRYIAMLLKFGEHFGCGVKTSMGMGRMKIEAESADKHVAEESQRGRKP